jgi:hypothetical protein
VTVRPEQSRSNGSGAGDAPHNKKERTTMNNNIEVMKSVWRRVKRPSAATLCRIKAKAELEARITLRYMALLACITRSGTNSNQTQPLGTNLKKEK